MRRRHMYKIINEKYNQKRFTWLTYSDNYVIIEVPIDDYICSNNYFLCSASGFLDQCRNDVASKFSDLSRSQ